MNPGLSFDQIVSNSLILIKRNTKKILPLLIIGVFIPALITNVYIQIMPISSFSVQEYDPRNIDVLLSVFDWLLWSIYISLALTVVLSFPARLAIYHIFGLDIQGKTITNGTCISFFKENKMGILKTIGVGMLIEVLKFAPFIVEIEACRNILRSIRSDGNISAYAGMMRGIILFIALSFFISMITVFFFPAAAYEKAWGFRGIKRSLKWLKDNFWRSVGYQFLVSLIVFPIAALLYVLPNFAPGSIFMSAINTLCFAIMQCIYGLVLFSITFTVGLDNRYRIEGIPSYVDSPSKGE